jgi:hypothetical protein
MFNVYNIRLAACGVALVFTATAVAAAPTTELALPAPLSEMSVEQWDSFSHSLVDGIASDNEGIRTSAMRLSVQYAGRVDVTDALIDVMSIYRNHADDNVRRMAVVTLGSMNSSLAKGYLELSQQFEKSPTVKRTIRAVLAGIADGSH